MRAAALATSSIRRPNFKFEFQISLYLCSKRQICWRCRSPNNFPPCLRALYSSRAIQASYFHQPTDVVLKQMLLYIVHCNYRAPSSWPTKSRLSLPLIVTPSFVSSSTSTLCGTWWCADWLFKKSVRHDSWQHFRRRQCDTPICPSEIQNVDCKWLGGLLCIWVQLNYTQQSQKLKASSGCSRRWFAAPHQPYSGVPFNRKCTINS